jgi:SPP1 gp7 family putative phage head morphogenesis protein
MSINTDIKKLLAKSGSEKALSITEQELIKLYKRTLTELNTELSRIINKYGAENAYQEMAKYNRLASMNNDILKTISKDYGIAKSDINGLLRDTFKMEYNNIGSSLSTATGIDLSLNPLSSKVVTKAIENPLKHIKWKGSLARHHGVAASEINQTVAQGIYEGKGYRDIAKNIKGRVNKLTNNALRIARTETHRVVSEARVEGFDQSDQSFERLGIESFRVLSSVIDSVTRPQSTEVNGRRAISDKNSPNYNKFLYPNGQYYAGPGMTGIAKYDINDREQIVTEINEDTL